MTMKTAALLLLCCLRLVAGPRWGGELRFCIYSDPKTFNPLLVSEQSAGAVRRLTGGSLIRWNRDTQRLEPELASAWKLSRDGREIRFDLREDARFSDGARVTAEDAAYTFRTLLDPKSHAPDADAFRLGDERIEVEAKDGRTLILRFSQPVAGVERLFDSIAIVSPRALAAANNPAAMPTAGPFHVAEYRPGVRILLARNPYYWRMAEGKRLPYLDSVRLEIQQNRSLEIASFLSGDLDLIDSVEPDSYARISRSPGVTAADAGPSLDVEEVWFNLNPGAPLPEFKKKWFQSREFLRAVSMALRREDMTRLVYLSHARPAAMTPPSNRLWANAHLAPQPFDLESARKSLASAGFHYSASPGFQFAASAGSQSVLLDGENHPVEFSIVTNAGNVMRERLAALIEQDLARIGIRVRTVTLDFPSLIERITRTFDYEVCLLGVVNDDPDPNSQINVWLSSGPNHPWHPGQKSPATAWEAEIDRLMIQQSREPDFARRKKAFDRVQEIVDKEAPVLFLVSRNSLCAYRSRVGNAAPSPFFPQLFWNIDNIYVRDGSR